MLTEKNLHEYQQTTVGHIIENPKAGVFLDMGLGKTVSTLTALKWLIYDDLEINRVLVVAPKRVTESVWTAEAKKWSHLKPLRLSRIIGSEKQRRAALAVKADVYLISRDNVSWLCGLYGGSKLPFDMLVIDESSSFKNQQSQRFKALKAVQANFRRVVILTGTPAPNGLLDLWAQIFLLDRGERLGKLIGKYRDEYFKPNQRNGDIIYSYKLRDGAESQIHEKIADICISMKAKDYLKLPKRITNYIDIEFSPSLMQQYEDFEQEQILQIINESEDGTVTATNAAALSNKLLQFAGGAVYDDERNVLNIHALKLEALEEIVEQASGKPVLVAWNYKHEEERILKKLAKYKPKALKKDEDIDEWNDGLINVMTMHPASGGHGLNLQTGGHILVWYSPTWSLELYQQFNARLDRQGQTKPVVVHHLVSQGTIDNDVLRALDKKTTTQDDLLNAIKAKVAAYKKLALID